jgi:hypothetical protein
MTVLAGVEVLPCVGGAITVVISCLGLGAALLSRFGSTRHQQSMPLSLSAPPRL